MRLPYLAGRGMHAIYISKNNLILQVDQQINGKRSKVTCVLTTLISTFYLLDSLYVSHNVFARCFSVHIPQDGSSLLITRAGSAVVYNGQLFDF